MACRVSVFAVASNLRRTGCGEMAFGRARGPKFRPPNCRWHQTLREPRGAPGSTDEMRLRKTAQNAVQTSGDRPEARQTLVHTGFGPPPHNWPQKAHNCPKSPIIGSKGPRTPKSRSPTNSGPRQNWHARVPILRPQTGFGTCLLNQIVTVLGVLARFGRTGHILL